MLISNREMFVEGDVFGRWMLSWPGTLGCADLINHDVRSAFVRGLRLGFKGDV